MVPTPSSPATTHFSVQVDGGKNTFGGSFGGHVGKATEVAARNSTPMFVPYSTCLVASTKEVDRGAYQLSVRDSRQHWYRFIRREHDHPPSVFTDVFTTLVNANGLPVLQ